MQKQIKSRAKTAVAPRNGRSELVRETSAQPTQTSSDTPLRSLRQLLQNVGKPKKTGRLSGRRAFDFDLRRPVKSRWPNADLKPWVTRQDAGLAALGHGWPVAAAHGFRSAGGYTERQRGAE
ncbi:hypothetical protein AO242_17390 [Pseudomonas sp. ICMP 561]|nr:hypothetical protein AO242_17390 [Pseudomonas sp. ICMP 561]